MRIFNLSILLVFLFLSCGQRSDENDAKHGDHSLGYTSNVEEQKLNVKDVLDSNPSVQVGMIQSKTVSKKVTCTGRIDVPPTELISVHSITSGFVDLIRFIPGDYVKKGTLLFTILNPDLVVKQRILLETKAELSLAEKDYARKQSLQAESAVTQKVFDEAFGRKEILSAKYSGLKSELKLLGINIEALETEKKFQTKHYIYASESGHVHKVLTNKGQMIHPDDKLMDIANNDHIHLELQILSKDVPFIKIGQKVQFTLPNNQYTYMADVIKLNPRMDEETGTLNVHCHIEKEHEPEMTPGLFVNAQIEVESIDLQGLPLEATIKTGEQYFGFFVEEGLLVKHQLENVQVRDGFVTFDNVPEGEIVIKGAYYLL
jgi:cobalt-zinc-cadmium efflux system membrane fusion protein